MSLSSAPVLSDDWAMQLKLLGLDALAGRTSELLDSEGVPSLLLKGPATAHRLYPESPGSRGYGDVDLLVPTASFDEAQRVLEEHAYRPMALGTSAIELAWYEVPWLAPSPAGALVVDLHRGFAGVGDSETFFRDLWDTRSTLLVGGVEVSVPSVAGTALIVALHAASPGRSPKPMVDLLRAQEVFDLQVWSDAAALARSCGAGSALRAGLELLPQGAALADQLGVSGMVTAHHWLGGRRRDRVSVVLAEALARPGLMSKGSFALRRVVPSPAFLRLSDPGARSGRWGLAAAYGRRIGRVLLTAPRAATDVLEARWVTAAGTRGQRSLRRSLVRGRRAVRTTVRILRHADRNTLAVARWAWSAHGDGRRQLRDENALQTLQLPAPPIARPADRAATQLVLRARNASCLEKSVVLQRFDAAAGRPRTLVVGVTSPQAGFRAHAWLEGDAQPDTALQEIHRREAPADWCAPTKTEAR